MHSKDREESTAGLGLDRDGGRSGMQHTKGELWNGVRKGALGL